MGSMDTTTQPTTLSAAAMISGFDGDAFVEKVIGAAAEQIRAGLPQPGLIDAAALRQLVEHHLAATLRPAVGGALVAAIHDVAARIDSRAADDAQLLSDPRYADAPAVTAKLALQRRAHKHYDETLKVIDVQLPAGWLARQERSDLQAAATDGDTAWIVEDLELHGSHTGPSELIINEDGPTGESLLALWLEATAVQN